MAYHCASLFQRSSVSSSPPGLLVLLLTLILHLTEAEGQLLQKPINLTGTWCHGRCEQSRPSGHRESFHFDCQDPPPSSNPQPQNCWTHCQSCPKQVCDETISSGSWHCPEIDLDGECNSICNDKRPKGNRQSYTLNCSSGTAYENKHCETTCYKCPHWVCNQNPPIMLNCPWDNLKGPCKLECDKARVQGVTKNTLSYVQSFQFSCKTASDKSSCQKACKDCPLYVCDAKNNVDEYHCPSAQLEHGPCKEFCDERAKATYQKGAHLVNCQKHFTAQYGMNQTGAKAKCKTLCKTCATSQGINFVCNDTAEFFLCPEPGPDNPIPKGQRSFKGICGEKCTASQGGGPQPFNLSCTNDKLYSTLQERIFCSQVCLLECPEKACGITPTNDTFIQCPGDTKKQKELNEKAQSKEKDQERQLAVLRDDKEQLIIFLSMLAIAVVVISVCFCFYCSKMKRRLRKIQHGQVVGGTVQVTDSRMSLHPLQPQQQHSSSSGHSAGGSPIPPHVQTSRQAIHQHRRQSVHRPSVHRTPN